MALDRKKCPPTTDHEVKHFGHQHARGWQVRGAGLLRIGSKVDCNKVTFLRMIAQIERAHACIAGAKLRRCRTRRARDALSLTPFSLRMFLTFREPRAQSRGSANRHPYDDLSQPDSKYSFSFSDALRKCRG
jgi:hypothetical protein